MKRRWSIWGNCVYLFCHCKAMETVRFSLWDSLKSLSSTNSVTAAYWSWQIIWKWKSPEVFSFNGKILLYSHSQVSFVTNCHFPLFHFLLSKVFKVMLFQLPIMNQTRYAWGLSLLLNISWLLNLPFFCVVNCNIIFSQGKKTFFL